MAMKKEFIVVRKGKTFVLYAGLLNEAHEQGLKSISTTLLQIPTDENKNVAICQATVETSKGTFSGIGDAAPNNVAEPMLNCLIRMAETRAKIRAIRDAVNIGVAVLEEEFDGIEATNSSQYRSTNNTSSIRVRPVSANNNGFATPATPSTSTNTNSSGGNNGNGGGQGGSDLATDKQVQAIQNIAYKRLFMTEEELLNRLKKSFGVGLDKLSRNEASQLIKSLNENVA
jgi:hypothetical protein